MPADARREPPSEAGHGHGRPPDGPPEEEPWGLTRGIRSLFKWPQYNAAPPLPPLTLSGLRGLQEDGHHEGGVHRPAAPSTGAKRSNVPSHMPGVDADLKRRSRVAARTLGVQITGIVLACLYREKRMPRPCQIALGDTCKVLRG